MEVSDHIEPPDGIEFKISEIDPTQMGTWSTKSIPNGTFLGPFVGDIVRDGEEGAINFRFAWEIFNLENGEYLYTINATDPAHGNWMRYVNCARYLEEQNLVSVQKDMEMFYKAIKDIEPGEELLTWYQPFKKRRKKKMRSPLKSSVKTGSPCKVEIIQEISPIEETLTLTSEDGVVLGKRQRVKKKMYDDIILMSDLIPKRRRRSKAEILAEKEKNCGHFDDSIEGVPKKRKGRKKKSLYENSLNFYSTAENDKSIGNIAEAENDNMKINSAGQKSKGRKKSTEIPVFTGSAESLSDHESSVSSEGLKHSKCDALVSKPKTSEEIRQIAEIEAGWKYPSQGQEYQFEHLARYAVTKNGRRFYRCDVCSGIYRHTFSLKRHYLRNHINCRYLSKADLANCLVIPAQQWLDIKHANEDEMPNRCLEKLDSGTSLNDKYCSKDDVATPGLYRCCICNKLFDVLETLISHTQDHPATPHLKFFGCDQCKMRFTFHQNLLRHKLVHEDSRQKVKKKKDKNPPAMMGHFNENDIHGKPYKCRQCPMKFRYQSNLEKHYQIHTADRPFDCSMCGKTFPNETNLKKHMVIHIGSSVHCKYCIQKFNHVGTLRKHIRLEHPIIHKERMLNLLEGRGQGESDTANKIRKSLKQLRKSQIEAPVDEKVETIGSYEKMVNVAKGTLENKVLEESEQQLPVHSKFKFSCVVCKKRFSAYVNMCRHRRMAHKDFSEVKSTHVESLTKLNNNAKQKEEKTKSTMSSARSEKSILKPMESEKKEMDNDGMGDNSTEAIQEFYANVASNIADNLNSYLDGGLDSLNNYKSYIKIEDYNTEPDCTTTEEVKWEDFNFPPNYNPKLIDENFQYIEIKYEDNVKTGPDKIDPSILEVLAPALCTRRRSSSELIALAEFSKNDSNHGESPLVRDSTPNIGNFDNGESPSGKDPVENTVNIDCKLGDDPSEQADNIEHSKTQKGSNEENHGGPNYNESLEMKQFRDLKETDTVEMIKNSTESKINLHMDLTDESNKEVQNSSVKEDKDCPEPDMIEHENDNELSVVVNAINVNAVVNSYVMEKIEPINDCSNGRCGTSASNQSCTISKTMKTFKPGDPIKHADLSLIELQRKGDVTPKDNSTLISKTEVTDIKINNSLTEMCKQEILKINGDHGNIDFSKTPEKLNTLCNNRLEEAKLTSVQENREPVHTNVTDINTDKIMTSLENSCKAENSSGSNNVKLGVENLDFLDKEMSIQSNLNACQCNVECCKETEAERKRCKVCPKSREITDSRDKEIVNKTIKMDCIRDHSSSDSINIENKSIPLADNSLNCGVMYTLDASQLIKKLAQEVQKMGNNSCIGTNCNTGTDTTVTCRYSMFDSKYIDQSANGKHCINLNEMHETNDAVASTNHVTEDAVTSTNHVTEDDVTSINHVTEDAVTSTNHVTEDAVTSTNHVTEDAVTSTNHVTKDNISSTNQMKEESSAENYIRRDNGSVEKELNMKHRSNEIELKATVNDSISDFVAKNEVNTLNSDMVTHTTLDQNAKTDSTDCGKTFEKMENESLEANKHVFKVDGSIISESSGVMSLDLFTDSDNESDDIFTGLALSKRNSMNIGEDLKFVDTNKDDFTEYSPFHNYEAIQFGKNGAIFHVCSVCKKHFEDLDRLLRHQWKKHPSIHCHHLLVEQGQEIENLYYYQPCNRGILGITGKALESVVDRGSYSCTRCGGSFKSVDRLRIHIINCAPKTENAEASENKPKYRKKYRKHQKMVIKSEPNSPMKVKMETMNMINDNISSTCNSLIKTKKQYLHGQKNIKIDVGHEKAEDTAEKIYRRKKSSEIAYNPMNHIRRRELTELLDTHQCKGCGVKFKSISLLERHVKKCDGKDKFKDLKVMKSNVNDTFHQKLKHSCLYCNRGFSYPKTLMNHYKAFCLVKKDKVSKGLLTENDKHQESAIMLKLKQQEEDRCFTDIPEENVSGKKGWPRGMKRKWRRKNHCWTYIKKRKPSAEDKTSKDISSCSDIEQKRSTESTIVKDLETNKQTNVQQSAEITEKQFSSKTIINTGSPKKIIKSTNEEFRVKRKYVRKVFNFGNKSIGTSLSDSIQSVIDQVAKPVDKSKSVKKMSQLQENKIIKKRKNLSQENPSNDVLASLNSVESKSSDVYQISAGTMKKKRKISVESTTDKKKSAKEKLSPKKQCGKQVQDECNRPQNNLKTFFINKDVSKSVKVQNNPKNLFNPLKKMRLIKKELLCKVANKSGIANGKVIVKSDIEKKIDSLFHKLKIDHRIPLQSGISDQEVQNSLSKSQRLKVKRRLNEIRIQLLLEIEKVAKISSTRACNEVLLEQANSGKVIKSSKAMETKCNTNSLSTSSEITDKNSKETKQTSVKDCIVKKDPTVKKSPKKLDGVKGEPISSLPSSMLDHIDGMKKSKKKIINVTISRKKVVILKTPTFESRGVKTSPKKKDALNIISPVVNNKTDGDINNLNKAKKQDEIPKTKSSNKTKDDCMLSKKKIPIYNQEVETLKSPSKKVKESQMKSKATFLKPVDNDLKKKLEEAGHLPLKSGHYKNDVKIVQWNICMNKSTGNQSNNTQ